MAMPQGSKVKLAGQTMRRLRRTCARVLAIGVVNAGAVLAQSTAPVPPPPPMQMGTAHIIADDPALQKIPPKQRLDLVEHVVGNILYVLLHELGHTHVTEMQLPVLGREEDAADAFAVVTMLKMGTLMSQHVLTHSAMGWFLMAKRDQKQGAMLLFYGEHGLDQQRAFNIVCLMVGSDPEKFKSLVEESKLPKARQETCKGDYENASWSWDESLKPHLRTPAQPKTKIDVIYGEGTGRHAYYAQAFRSLRLLEIVASHAEDQYVWRRPFTIEMRTCGNADAKWSPFERKVIVCYEMAVELAEIYRDYGRAPKAVKRRR